MMLFRVAHLPRLSFLSGILSLPILLASLGLWSGETFAQDSREPTTIESTFVNPIGEGADPWVIRDPNAERYLWCLSEGNRAIAIHTSGSVTSLGPIRACFGHLPTLVRKG